MDDAPPTLPVGMYRGYVDKVPAGTLSSVATVEMMDIADAPFPEAHLNAEMMARLAATSHTVLGMDSIMPVWHSQLESDALGGDTDWAEKDNWPSPSQFVHQRTRPGRRAGGLRAAAHHQDRHRRHAHHPPRTPTWPSWARSTGPGRWATRSSASKLPDGHHPRPGQDQALPRRFPAGLYRSAQAQFEAGADAVMWADHTTGDLCSAETYRDFLLEMHQQITQEIGGPGIFHCCGKTIDRVAPVRQRRLGLLPLRIAGRRPRGAHRGGRTDVLFGNLNNPTLLYQGTAEDVYKACWDLLDAGVDGLAPEGSVPLITKKEPLQAIARRRPIGPPNTVATASSW